MERKIGWVRSTHKDIRNKYKLSEHPDSLVSVYDTGWTIGVRIPAGPNILLLSKTSRLGLGLSQPPIQRVPVLRRPRSQVNHSPPPSAEAKYECRHYTFCPHSVFVCSVRISEQTEIISLYSINWLFYNGVRACLLRGTEWVFKYII
jgi:hypothetical protein